MTVIIDYHNTIPDQYDNTANNKLSKIFTIEAGRQSEISLDIFPSYLIPKKDSVIKINGTLAELDSGTPLAGKNVIIMIGNERESALITDKNGKFSISKAITFSSERLVVSASYEGNFPNLPVNYTGYVFNLPQSKETAAIVLQINDPTRKYDFQNLPSQIAVFQDSYDNLYRKILTTQNSVLLDNTTAWFALPGDHSYLEEIYVDGRFFFSTDWKKIATGQVLQQSLIVPETAQIRFHVTDKDGNPLEEVSIKNWIYSAVTDGYGYTPWIDMLPTRTKNEPYVATVTSDGNVFDSQPFFLATGERKIIEINLPQSQLVIPSWIKNNAKWWSEGSIDDSDFVKGIQYLIQQKIIVIPQSAPSGEGDRHIPLWIKNNAKWWSEGSIKDSDFVKGIQYLIKMGVIQV